MENLSSVRKTYRARKTRHLDKKRPGEHAIATSTFETKPGEDQDTWTRAMLVPEVTTHGTDVQDTWTRAAHDHNVVDEHQPGKHATATSILGLYDRYGALTASANQTHKAPRRIFLPDIVERLCARLLGARIF